MHTKFIYTLIGLFLGIGIATAQTADNPWRLQISANAVDIYPTNQDASTPFAATQGAFFEDFLNVGDHWNIGGPTVSLSRYLFGGFSIGAQLSLNSITKIAGETNVDYPYYSADGIVSYRPFGGKFTPFLQAGFGLTSFDLSGGSADSPFLLSRNASKTFLYGLGFDIGLSDQWGLTIQSTFRNAYELYGINNFQHQLGVSYNFGAGDRDKDGVSDKKDKCPDVPGLKEFEGCPDTDEDGIPDNEDRCPEEPGTAENKGCPDTDGDGVVDIDDVCPEAAGTAEMSGCPDTDGDGVHDGEDKCVEEAGDPENEGCPWPDTDGDGVVDKDDVCPEIKGPESSKGCPIVADAIMQTLNDYGAMINFMAESDKILGAKTMEVLEKIKELLIKYPEGVIVIEGYASEDGDLAANEALSKARAESVKKYLMGLGIEAERLETVGMGVNNPIEDDNTVEGRAKNRRVQFKTKF